MKVIRIRHNTGIVGVWYLDNEANAVESGLLFLTKLFNSDNQGFDIEYGDCLRMTPPNLVAFDTPLAYMDPMDAITMDGSVNLGLFTRILYETSRNTPYKDWLLGYLNNMDGCDTSEVFRKKTFLEKFNSYYLDIAGISETVVLGNPIMDYPDFTGLTIADTNNAKLIVDENATSIYKD